MSELAEPMSHSAARDIGPFKSLQIVKPFGAQPFIRSEDAPTVDVSLGSGHVIPHCRIANVYINGGPPADSPDFDEWSKAVVEDGHLDQLSVYGVGRGTFIGSYRLDVGIQTGVLADAQLQDALHAAIANGTLPAPDASTAFHFIMPDGLAHDWQGSGTCGDSTIGYCGIHVASSQGVLYSVIGSPECYGCHGQFDPRQTRMGAWSHELCEELTNPYGDAVWDRVSGEEIGDLCIYWPDPHMPSAGPQNMVQYGPPEKNWWVQAEWIIAKGCQTSPYQAPQPAPKPKPVPQPTKDPDPASYQSRFWHWLRDVAAWATDKSEAARRVEAEVVLQVLERAYPDVASNVSHELEQAPAPPNNDTQESGQ